MGRLAVALLVALGALLVSSGPPVAPWLDRVSGAEPRAIFEVTLPPGADAQAIEETWRARLGARLLSVERGATPEQRVVTVACTGPYRHCDSIEIALFRTATMEIREVRAGTPTMRAVFAVLREQPDPAATEEVESWRDPTTGRDHLDYFVVGPHRSAVAGAIERARATGAVPALAADEEIVYEVFDDVDEDGTPRRRARSYVVGGAPWVTDRDVLEVIEISDPDTYRPEVLITFTDEGARRFGDATTRIVGGKIAIIVDGVVLSAPVVHTPILGGRVTISVDPGPLDEQTADVDALVEMLGPAPTLPPGIRVVDFELVPTSMVRRWAARGGVALLAGALAWILATLIVRASTAAARVVSTRRGRAGDLVLPVAVTVLGVGVIEHLAGVFLPGLSLDLRDMIDASARVDGARRIASPVALGATPVVTAYVVVELIAWAVPALRRRRVGSSAERAPLELAVAILAFAFALMQSYFVLRWLHASGDAGFRALDKGALVGAGIVASLVGGVAIHAVVAQVITRHGLCNGWLVLVGYQAVRNVAHEPEVAGLALLGAVLAVGLTARRAPAPDARRLPVAGLVPAQVIPMILGVLALPYLVSGWSADRVLPLLNKEALQIGLACGVAVLLSLRRGTPAPVAMLTAIGLSAAIAGFPQLGLGAPLLAGAIAGVLCAELVDGARVRLSGEVALVTIHDVERADEHVDLLRAGGIPASPTGARARGLYRGLGAFVPVTIHVPRDRAEDAATILRLPPSRPSAPLPPPSAATGG